MSDPFQEDEVIDKNPKVTLKKVSSQKSFLESVEKKPSKEDLEKNAKIINDKKSAHKIKASEINKKFYKALMDKTLVKNKKVFQNDIEREILSEMIQVANDINNDPLEDEGIGTLVILVPLLKTCLSQRDRINDLEYSIFVLEKKIENILSLISPENSSIDKK